MNNKYGYSEIILALALITNMKMFGATEGYLLLTLMIVIVVSISKKS